MQSSKHFIYTGELPHCLLIFRKEVAELSAAADGWKNSITAVTTGFNHAGKLAKVHREFSGKYNSMASSATAKRDLSDTDSDDDYEEFSQPRFAGTSGYLDYESTDQITLDSPIPATNKGYLLLQKMGWKAGSGLGSSGQGRLEPIRTELKEDSLGVGKAEEEQSYHISSTARRKALDSEKQLEETEEDRAKREMKAQKKEAIQRELEEVKRAFYCELCDKQYKKISEYEQHLQSYDHHHRKRFKDMREQTKKSAVALNEQKKKREREKKREERELRRIQETAQKRMNDLEKEGKKPVTSIPKPSPSSSSASGTGGGGGWTNVNPLPASAASSGWTTVTAATAVTPTSSAPSAGGWASVPAASGWTAVTSSTTQPTSTATPPSNPLPSVQPTASSPTSISTTPATEALLSTNSGNKPQTQGASKFSFGLPQKKPGGFQFGLKKK
ncbi:uncharacterized protein BYT42DRAFT_556057 [Radiomyces spectabilis]|uniref:uncharacterized protein n=1 Tax=Radiomyces spectabilis TaxID=64574 RepID=UPI002220C1B5|nr:uncharacterized protein BYT42DRAFT_556057 [Radiomyces spectabilis]KAI8391216.1 hypothetical protein BYT42DRAFT_556057 [Radiomyces spectabilis]